MCSFKSLIITLASMIGVVSVLAFAGPLDSIQTAALARIDSLSDTSACERVIPIKSLPYLVQSSVHAPSDHDRCNSLCAESDLNNWDSIKVIYSKDGEIVQCCCMKKTN